LVPLRRFLSLGTPITLRQGARMIEDSRRLRLGQRSTARVVDFSKC